MASRYLLDTSALIAHSRQETGWPRVQSLFEENDSEILACSVSLTEFARRLRELGATSEEARRTVADYLELLDEVVSIDEVVAFLAFDIGCAMEKRLPLTDALIAAAAHRSGACLVHRDQHMVAIPADVVTQIDLAAESEGDQPPAIAPSPSPPQSEDPSPQPSSGRRRPTGRRSSR